jgi:flagellin
VPAINAGRILNKNTSALNRTLQSLSSGLRINSARDDAAGLAIAESFRSQVRGAVQAQRNAQDGLSMVQTAEGALAETTNMLQRVRELAVQASNGTLSDTNRTAINAEVEQLLDQVDDIAWDTEFNGIKVLSNTGTTITIQSGYNEGQVLTVSSSGASSRLLGVSGIEVSSMDSAVSALSTIDLAIRSVTTLRGEFGAKQNRLEFTVNNLAIQEENSAASESAIRDADIARVTTAFTKNQILVSAGTSVLAQANIVPQNALTLLG